MHLAVVGASEISGGAEQYLYRLYSSLVADFGVRVTVVGSFPEWPAGVGDVEAIDAGPKFTRRRSLRVQAVESIKYAPQVLKAVHKAQPDLIHIQYFREKILLCGALSRKYPVIWTEHAPLPQNFPIGGRNLVAHQAGKASVIAVSTGVALDLESSGIASTVISNPLPGTLSQSASDIVGNGSNYVLYVGRLHHHKRVHLLLDAAARMSDQLFVIAGTGPAADDLKARATRNVRFVGHVEITEALYRRSRVVVIPSGREAREGLPMAMLEARSVGTRVLMANDCHAAVDAVEYGSDLFAPTVEDLIEGLAKHSILDRSRVSRNGLSESDWVQQHYDLFSLQFRARGT